MLAGHIMIPLNIFKLYILYQNDIETFLHLFPTTTPKKKIPLWSEVAQAELFSLGRLRGIQVQIALLAFFLVQGVGHKGTGHCFFLAFTSNFYLE